MAGSISEAVEQRLKTFSALLAPAISWIRHRPWRHIFKIAGATLGALILVIVVFLMFADWNALRRPIGKMASAMLGRNIEITGNLEVHPWSFTPRIAVSGLKIGDPNWGKRSGVTWGGDGHYFAYVPQATAQIELAPLLAGDLVMRSLELREPDIHLARNENGRANWSRDPSVQTANKPLRLPLIKRFLISDGKLELADQKRKMLLQAKLESREVLQRGTRKAFQLTGDGLLNQKKFMLELTCGALINVNRSRPYRFELKLKAGATDISATGSLRRPFDFGRYTADVIATGDYLANLYYVIGLALPNTPPYRLTTKLM